MKYHILSIGVSKHQVVTPDLGFAHSDAIDFYELFSQNVPSMGASQLLVDNEATLSGIRTALANPELQNADKEDAFFFFFSGHGTTAPAGDALAHYLVPYDATGDFASSCVSVEYLKEAFSKIPCKAQLVFVDSCFSGAVSKGTKFLPGPQFKELKEVRKLSEVIPGTGNVDLRAEFDSEQKYYKLNVQRLQKEYDRLDEEIKDMFRDRSSFKIRPELFDELVSEKAEMQADLLEQIKDHTKGNERFVISSSKILEVAKNASELFLSDKVRISQKRRVVEFVLSNLRLDGETLLFNLNQPFDSIAYAVKNDNWGE